MHHRWIHSSANVFSENTEIFWNNWYYIALCSYKCFKMLHIEILLLKDECSTILFYFIHYYMLHILYLNNSSDYLVNDYQLLVLLVQNTSIIKYWWLYKNKMFIIYCNTVNSRHMRCGWLIFELSYNSNGCLRRPYKQLRKEEKWKAKEKRKDIPIWMQSSKE